MGGEAHWQGFIGVVPCFLAILAAWAAVDRRRLPYAALGLSVPILVLYTPLGPVLYERFFLLYIFCASVLAAFGCTAACTDELIAPRARLAVRAIAGFIAATVATLIAINIALASAGDRIRAFVDAQVSATLATNYFGQTYPALYIQKAHQFLDDLRLISPQTAVPILVAVAGLVAISSRTQRRLGAPWFARIGVTLTVVDMVFMTVTHVPFVDIPRYPFTPSSPAIDRVRNDVGIYRVISYRSPSGPPVMPLGLVSTYGIEAADGNDDLGPPNLFQLISFAHKPCGGELCVEPRNTDLAGVRYILAGPDVRLPHDRFELVYDREMRVYQDRGAVARAFWVNSYEVVQDTAGAVARVKSAAFDSRVTVVLDRHPRSVSGASSEPTEFAIIERTPLMTAIRVDAKTAGLLVLSDTYYPGWKADLDGKPVQIFRANGVMRAVAVPAGPHTIRFEYAPRSFQLGAAISLSSLVGVLAVVLFAGRNAADALMRT